MAILIDSDVDPLWTGVCIAVIVCMISSALYFMFKNAALVPAPLSTRLHDFGLLRRKNKKQESKKSRKPKKTTSLLGTANAVVTHEGENVTNSDQGIEEEEEEEEEDDDNVSTLEELSIAQLIIQDTVRQTSDHEYAENKWEDVNMATDATDSENLPIELISEVSDHMIIKKDVSPTFQPVNQLSPLERDRPSLIESPISSSLPDSAFQLHLKSKRSKRKSSKRVVGTLHSPNDSYVIQPLNLPSVEHIVEPMEELSTCSSSKQSAPNIPPNESTSIQQREECLRLSKQLQNTEQKLTEATRKLDQLKGTNGELGRKEEATALGLRVLQQQYTELLRANKTIEHEKQLKENELKNLGLDKERILVRLTQANENLDRIKTETERDACGLREQLAETKNKLNALMTRPPPGPSPELLRTKEVVQMVSNENHMLKTSLEQAKAEVNQLRQSSMMQQQDLQVLRAEKRNLLEKQDAALDELRTKHQVEKLEATTRIASYEAQIQRQCRELEGEKQELVKQLSEVGRELSSRTVRERQLTEIISSLEYKFAELNAEKQHLLQKVDEAKAVSETSTSELRLQVANLSNELSRITAELQSVEQREAALSAELEQLKATRLESGQVNADVEQYQENLKQQLQVNKDLRHQLTASHKETRLAKIELGDKQKELVFTVSELQHYKNTLLQTEELLGKVQAAVEDTEDKWRQLLIKSEEERDKLEGQLLHVRSELDQVKHNLKDKDTQLVQFKAQKLVLRKPLKILEQPEQLRKKYLQVPWSVANEPEAMTPITPASPTCPVDGDVNLQSSKPEQKEVGPSHIIPESLESADIDYDSDAVLIDDTDLHVDDDVWDSTTKMSEVPTNLDLAAK